MKFKKNEGKVKGGDEIWDFFFWGLKILNYIKIFKMRLILVI